MCHRCTANPPTPSGFSSLWSGPAVKPSREMDWWQVTRVMVPVTLARRRTHRGRNDEGRPRGRPSRRFCGGCGLLVARLVDRGLVQRAARLVRVGLALGADADRRLDL